MCDLSEYAEVERPYVQQLQSLGWGYLAGDTEVPYLTERESFHEVLLLDRLRQAVRRINLDEAGRPWLDDAQVAQVVGRLERLAAHHLMEANAEGYDLLRNGTQVEGADGRQQTVRFIDLQRPEGNDWLAINQFRVDPPWSSDGRGCTIADIVLLVNGIPLVVVECKSPGLENPLDQGITQLLRYSNQRPWVSEPEGAERLFQYNALMVATCFEKACMGTVGAQHEHYLQWKDTYPIPQEQVRAELGVAQLSGQQTLVAGMLRPAHLLDLLQSFSCYQSASGRMVKIVARYQQYRAVHKALARLQTGATRRAHGEADQRGGIIWHTQGSGKSLTMVFLVRVMRTLPVLQRFKVVVVTDRTDLEKQLSETAALTGEPLQKAESVARLQQLLREPGAGLVFGMIQKYQGAEGEAPKVPYFPQRRTVSEELRRVAERPTAETGAGEPGDATLWQDVGVLNESEEILVLVDEAHRSHTSALHANLLQALPNCARIGFTGTPILSGAKKRTHEIFGPFIDIYTIQQSQEDGATVPIVYEGRTARGNLADGERLDQLFEDMSQEYTPEQLERLKARYATTGHVLEAPKLIAAKARDMLRHYVAHVLPDGFKAQVVAVSRLAAVRYRTALLEARDALVRRLEGVHPALLGRAPGEQEGFDEETRFLVQAYPHLDAIRRLEFATVISGGGNDDPAWKEWTDKSRQDAHIGRFKKSLAEDGLAFLVVKSMLLTGFDAPVEQVMYLDRPIREHELLQAIARVNRTYTHKEHGLVVDYYGVTHHLKEVLEVYSAADVEGAIRPLGDELPKLDDRHRRVVALFTSRGRALDDIEACVHLLRDDGLRAEFQRKFKEFINTLNAVLPRPEALRYVSDARRLGYILYRAANRYRDEDLTLVGAGQKVRELIDRYVEAQGIDPKVPPIDILAADFEAHVSAQGSPRSQAAEMEYAARYHLRVHFAEDPVYYRKLSQRLEEILRRFEENWEALVAALREYTHDLRAGRPADRTGLDPQAQAPFMSLLVEAAADEGAQAHDLPFLAQATVQMVEAIRERIGRVDFWRNRVAQEELRGWVVDYLDRHDLVPFEKQEALADQIVQLARALHTRLVRV